MTEELPRFDLSDLDAATARPVSLFLGADGSLWGEEFTTHGEMVRRAVGGVEPVQFMRSRGMARLNGYVGEGIGSWAAVFFVPGQPTAAQLSALHDMNRVVPFTELQWRTAYGVPKSGDDLRSLRGASAVRANPSLWQRVPEDVMLRVESYGVRRQDEDEFLYHVTTATNARRILASGLQPGRRGTFAGLALRAYSEGRVFLTEIGGVRFWLDRLEEHLAAAGRWTPTARLVVLRVPKASISVDLEPDQRGTLDARARSWMSSHAIGAAPGRARRHRA